jgi:hypothetical protein
MYDHPYIIGAPVRFVPLSWCWAVRRPSPESTTRLGLGLGRQNVKVRDILGRRSTLLERTADLLVQTSCSRLSLTPVSLASAFPHFPL